MVSILFNSNLRETSAVLRISGPDAYTYLQGQFTQDLNAPAGFARYGLWLNQKGRVLADSVILRRDRDEFFIISHSANAQILRERLEGYLIADEVTIEDETDRYGTASLWGDSCKELLKTLLGQALATGGFGTNPNGWFAYLPRGQDEQRFELLIPIEQLAAARQALLNLGAQFAGRADFERARIEQGIPAVPSDIGTSDLPNEGGLDEVAISYTKGCYLGQEVMARLKNLGQVRRRLHIVRGDGVLPSSLTAVFQEGKKVGELRSVAATPGGFVAMAMLSLVNFDASRGLSLAVDAAPALSVVRRV